MIWGKHDPVRMVEVDTFDEVFLLTVEDICVFECPFCNRQVTEFAKNFYFDDSLSLCVGMEEMPLPELKEMEDTPF